MKKLIMILAAALLFAATLAGQSLTNNEYFRKSLELERKSNDAFEYGDYDAAADYAAQAQEYAEMSDLYVAQMLLKKDAETAFAEAQARYDWVSGPEVDAALRYPLDYAAATLALEEAKLELSNDSYDKAIEQSKKALSLLALMQKTPVFPAFYVVERKQTLTDCLWRIAELPAVYNDPYLWTELYKANRSIMPEPNNPDLILPGMILRIPALNNEKREGTWQAGVEYPVFEKSEN
ncbi:MAG: hypothetical protein KKI09_07670 [Spirochaetes bacterium]|nr:hypothetical protein [Spirochaetota bacterium]MBU0955291.1 hypothetical protein [Spirochaetota bacterium]